MLTAYFGIFYINKSLLGTRADLQIQVEGKDPRLKEHDLLLIETARLMYFLSTSAHVSEIKPVAVASPYPPKFDMYSDSCIYHLLGDSPRGTIVCVIIYFSSLFGKNVLFSLILSMENYSAIQNIIQFQ